MGFRRGACALLVLLSWGIQTRGDALAPATCQSLDQYCARCVKGAPSACAACRAPGSNIVDSKTGRCRAKTCTDLDPRCAQCHTKVFTRCSACKPPLTLDSKSGKCRARVCTDNDGQCARCSGTAPLQCAACKRPDSIPDQASGKCRPKRCTDLDASCTRCDPRAPLRCAPSPSPSPARPFPKPAASPQSPPDRGSSSGGSGGPSLAVAPSPAARISSPELAAPRPPPPGDASPTPAPTAGSWVDDFSGGLNRDLWDVSDLNVGVNDELQYYSPNNVYCDREGLHLAARREARAGQPFTSGKLISKRGLATGRVAVTATLPPGVPGLWPAVWLVPTTLLDGRLPWPTGGEIDIMEWRGRTGENVGSLHYLRRAAPGEPAPQRREDWMDAEACHGLGGDGRSCHMVASGWAPPTDNATRHTWAARWDGEGIEWAKDGRAFYDVRWADWFPAGPCDVLAGPDAWPRYPRKGSTWLACNPFASAQEWVVVLNLAVGGVFDSPGGVQQAPPAGDAGPWEFVVHKVEVTPL